MGYKYPIQRFFEFGHLSEHLQAVAEPFARLADTMAQVITNQETAAGLRKLLEAKDCAVRAALLSHDGTQG